MSKQQPMTITSKSQSIKPVVVSDVGELDQIRIDAPSYLGYVDSTQSYLKMRVQMNVSRGEIVPDPLLGAHGFIRNFRLRDGSNSTTIESSEDYNARVASVRPFTKMTDTAHKDDLTEGVQASSSRGNRQSLYYSAGQAIGNDETAPQRSPRGTQTIEVYLQPEMGFLKSKTILPVAALQGLRMEIDTEDTLRSCVDLATNNLSISTDGDHAAGSFTRGAGIYEFDILTTLTTSSNQFNNDFSIGDILWMALASGDSQIVLGAISGFSKDASNKLRVHFTVQQDGSPVAIDYPAGSSIFVKVAERQVSQTLEIWDGTSAVSTTFPAPSYTLSDIEYLAMTVQPPTAFVEQQMKASLSDKGMEFDFLTSEMYRFNQVNVQGITQVQIPTTTQRAKSIVCQPLLVSSYRDLSQSSFSGVPDQAVNYNFVFGSELVPSRSVPLSRYSQAVGTTQQHKSEPLHMTELQKAITNIGQRVVNLQKISDHFSIARALNRYNQITPITESVSLRVEYGSGGQQKLFNSYVYKIAKMFIAKGQVVVV